MERKERREAREEKGRAIPGGNTEIISPSVQS
jgi:hypothetical protein